MGLNNFFQKQYHLYNSYEKNCQLLLESYKSQFYTKIFKFGPDSTFIVSRTWNRAVKNDS